ncbi:hypothetical protein DL93DRAFT_1791742 [Clavulina sp. PMI_390]|nr:hypothetical protein DL93DRAFT_1791742 [Clavulina sp. PMI_390]
MIPRMPSSGATGVEANSGSQPPQGGASDPDADLLPSELMNALDAHGPRRFDYAYLLERAGNVFAKQGAVLQALHLYRSAADALVPRLTGDPESWANLDSKAEMVKGLPVREVCQVATLVNNMASVVSGANSGNGGGRANQARTAPANSNPASGSVRTEPLPGSDASSGHSPNRASRGHDGEEDHRDASAGRSGNHTAPGPSQPAPDLARARRLALAAAKLVEAVSPRNSNTASKSWLLGLPAQNEKKPVIVECELARLASACNLGALAEVSDDGCFYIAILVSIRLWDIIRRPFPYCVIVFCVILGTDCGTFLIYWQSSNHFSPHCKYYLIWHMNMTGAQT